MKVKKPFQPGCRRPGRSGPATRTSYQLSSAARREASHIAPARVVDCRRVATSGFSADGFATRIVDRRRILAVGGRAADDSAGRVIERCATAPMLRRSSSRAPAALAGTSSWVTSSCNPVFRATYFGGDGIAEE